MNFSIFFTEHIYLLFGIFIYVIYNSGRHKKYNARIIVIYMVILFLWLIKSLRIKYMIFIFCIVSFLQFEFLIDDDAKLKIVSGFFRKIFDCIYLLVFKYNFLLYLLSLYFLSKLNLPPLSELNVSYFFKLPTIGVIYLALSILIFIATILSISYSKFELHNFNEIIKKLKPDDFETFNNIDDIKIRILTDKEDKTYFYRSISYNFISWWILLFKVQTMNRLILSHRFSHVFNVEKEKPSKKLKSALSFVKGFIRGYSTLEMQLFRQVAIKEGYNKKISRKIAEVFYSQILFSGLKSYLKKNYQHVSNIRYKKFLINRYIKNAPAFIFDGNREYYDKLFEDRKVSNGDFLLFTLSLSKSLYKLDILEYGLISFDKFKNKYGYKLFDYSISDSEIKKSIDYYNNRKKIYM